MSASAVRVTARIHGNVQGVGFRWFARRVAREDGLTGYAVNLPDGTVEVVAEGPCQACERFVDTLRGRGAPGRVDRVTVDWSQPTGLLGFAID